MSKSINSKYNINNIIRLLFFIGTFIVSFLTIFIVILASIHADGLQSSFIFSHPTITNILILIVFFLNISKQKDNKVYYWFTLTTLISAVITLIFSSSEMAKNVDLLLNRHDIFNFFFRLHKIILPSLYLIFYIFLDKHTLSKKRSLLVIFVYPLFYVVAVQVLGSLSFVNTKDNTNTLKSFFSIKGFIFNILKIMFLFLPLTPSVLGITFLKEEFMNKNQLKTSFLVLGVFLIIVTLGGFWYPFPFSKSTLNTFNNKNFANRLIESYADNLDLDTISTDNNNESFFQQRRIAHTKKDSDNSSKRGFAETEKSNQHLTPPSKIYKDKYGEKEVGALELKFVQDNWETIKKNEYKYTFNDSEKKLIFDLYNSENSEPNFFRQSKGWHGRWQWS